MSTGSEGWAVAREALVVSRDQVDDAGIPADLGDEMTIRDAPDDDASLHE
ncbi:MAG TPA: hypothetical protein VMN39_00415 [Longimicrobiaceae bacterium]|nr:hypothetical protein [Longimicrobiaceae bacterium]